MPDNDKDLTTVLFDRGILIDLFIGKPTFQKRLKTFDLLLDDIDTDVIYLGHKKLLPKVALRTLTNIEISARGFVSNRSMPFPLSRARFINYSVLNEVITELKVIKERWTEAVNDLITVYPSFKEIQIAKLDLQAESRVRTEIDKLSAEEKITRQPDLTNWLNTQKMDNRNSYPSVDKVRAMFTLTWRMFKVGGISGTEEFSLLSQEELLDEKLKIKEELAKWVKQASTEMHKVLGEAATHTAQLLSKQGKLNKKNIKPLFDAFEVFKCLDFTNSSSFQDVINEIKSVFGFKNNDDIETTTDAINNSLEEFKGMLGQLSSLTVDRVAEEAGLTALNKIGDFKRLIEV